MNTLTQKAINVFLVDDHSFVRDALTSLLEHESDIKVCGKCGDSRTALKMLEKSKPDVMIIDLHLGEEDGIKLVEEIHNSYPLIGVIVFSVHESQMLIRRCFDAGANGYVPKKQSAAELVTAIRHVYSGKTYFKFKLSNHVPSRIENNSSYTAFHGIEFLS